MSTKNVVVKEKAVLTREEIEELENKKFVSGVVDALQSHQTISFRAYLEYRADSLVNEDDYIARLCKAIYESPEVKEILEEDNGIVGFYNWYYDIMKRYHFSDYGIDHGWELLMEDWKQNASLFTSLDASFSCDY